MAGVDATLHKLEKRRVVQRKEELKRLLRSQSANEMSSECVVLASTESDSEERGEESEGKDEDSSSVTGDQLQCRRGKRGKKVIITSQMTAALDRSKLADRKVMMIVTETANSLGHEVSDLALNRETICHS